MKLFHHNKKICDPLPADLDERAAIQDRAPLRLPGAQNLHKFSIAFSASLV
jgi:hypothetical protein